MTATRRRGIKSARPATKARTACKPIHEQLSSFMLIVEMNGYSMYAMDMMIESASGKASMTHKDMMDELHRNLSRNHQDMLDELLDGISSTDKYARRLWKTISRAERSLTTIDMVKMNISASRMVELMDTVDEDIPYGLLEFIRLFRDRWVDFYGRTDFLPGESIEMYKRVLAENILIDLSENERYEKMKILCQ